MSFFLIERHLLASLHRVVNLRANSVFTILALCLTLVCSYYGINEPSTEKEYKRMKCVIAWLFFRSFQFISVILPADMLKCALFVGLYFIFFCFEVW